MAVDYWGQALVLTSSGGNWTATKTGVDSKDGISCPTQTFCAAVDMSGQAFTYNGSSWSVS